MPRLPKTYYNIITLSGAGLALVALGSIAISFSLHAFGYYVSPYHGIFTFILFPGVMFIGLFLIPFGIWRETKRLRDPRKQEKRALVIDLNQATHRVSFSVFLWGTLFLLIISAIGFYETYHYSESVSFCGEICHKVMSPEYTAYQNSPHARVRCAECHIGEGADWFVKAKISGMYQVYSVLFNKYPTPIETPIRNLRPARETCERCHWPQKFSANLEMAKTYFPFDSTLTKPWSITLQLKIGGGHSELGPVHGIHWHMSDENTIEYIATDDKRQVIPWVKITRKNGESKVFTTEKKTKEADLAKGERRTMDCIDCHNRPAHIYHSPFRTLNDAMAQQRIPPMLPNVRSVASFALTQEYSTKEQAKREIDAVIKNYYRNEAPSIAVHQAADINKTVAEVQRIYERNFFPEMKVRWKEYPNNIGHMYSEGCFRCHDNQHRAADGSLLASECNTCHLIVAQGPQGKQSSDINGLPFVHPVNINGAERTEKCTTCHNGE
jgi:hypothetical protein